MQASIKKFESFARAELIFGKQMYNIIQIFFLLVCLIFEKFFEISRFFFEKFRFYVIFFLILILGNYSMEK
jgi:hypothetical protein